VTEGYQCAEASRRNVPLDGCRERRSEGIYDPFSNTICAGHLPGRDRLSSVPEEGEGEVWFEITDIC